MTSFAEQMGNIVADLAATAAARASYLADLRQECHEDQANREHLTEETREAVQELLTDFASKREEVRADLAAAGAIWETHSSRLPRAQRRAEPKREVESSRRKKHRAKER
ncbi:MAG: hypothetical protein AABY63_07135 [candidate division NC10 bacterium]